VTWDLRPAGAGGGFGGRGPLVKPGKYTVTLEKVEGKTTTALGEPQTVEVAPLTPAVAAVQP